MYSDCFVVIRSAGERTTSLCNRLILDFGFTTSQLKVIKEVPFSAAVKKCLEIGHASNKEWLVCLDADVLISNSGFKTLMASLKTTKPDVFCVQGLVLDKFFNVFRPAGNHCYRVSLARKAIKFIPQEGTSLRPESSMKQEMAMLGFNTIQISEVIGLHDYEQYFSDIYRKCFLQAHKHKQYTSYLERTWNELGLEDTDYRVALLGLRAGKIYNNAVFVDKRFLEKEINDTLMKKQLNEKFEVMDEFKIDVDREIKSHTNADFQEVMFPRSLWNVVYDKAYFERRSNDKNTKQKWKKGTVFKFVRRVGSTFIRTGQWLHSKAKNISN